MKNECSIVRDILPLYIENMVSDDTASFVEAHLENCADCRKIATEMKEPAGTSDLRKSDLTSYANEAAPLKLVKKKLRRKQILTILLSFILAAALVWGVVSALFLRGIPVVSKNVKLETKIQYSDDAQAFVLRLTHLAGKPLSTSVKYVYQKDERGRYVYDENGDKIHVGYEVTVREVPYGINPSNYAIGYSYVYSSPPDEDFDFTITVKFRDTTVTYSMVEEGLFSPQGDIQTNSNDTEE